MKNSTLLLPILFLLFSSCKGQTNESELSPYCLEYFIKNTIQNTEFENNKCAQRINTGGDFILRTNENEYLNFSTNKNGKLNGKMTYLKNGDTLYSATHKKGILLKLVEYKNGYISKVEELKDSIYHITLPNIEDSFMLNNEIIFKSKSFHLTKNLKNEILEQNIIDNAGVVRYTINYKLNSSFLYNSKGILIKETLNSINSPQNETENINKIITIENNEISSVLLGLLRPYISELQPYRFEGKTKEHKTILYNEKGNIIQENIFEIDDVYGKDIEVFYFYSGKTRKKEVLYLRGEIKTRTYDLNNNLIKETIKIIDDNPEIEEVPAEPLNDDFPIEIIQEGKN